jgi:hypothetical protein
MIAPCTQCLDGGCDTQERCEINKALDRSDRRLRRFDPDAEHRKARLRAVSVECSTLSEAIRHKPMVSQPIR